MITPGATFRRDSGLMMLRREDDIARVYVPLQQRKAVIEAHHVAIKHLEPDKTYASLHRNYVWPTMRNDIRELCTDCRLYELSKARPNQSHRQRDCVHPPINRRVQHHRKCNHETVLSIFRVMLVANDQRAIRALRQYLQEIASAWNTTPKESLGDISPFEVYSGTRP